MELLTLFLWKKEPLGTFVAVAFFTVTLLKVVLPLFNSASSSTFTRPCPFPNLMGSYVYGTVNVMVKFVPLLVVA